jgi:ABC-type glycerol-3-phosphate transport system substrate-binding protein
MSVKVLACMLAVLLVFPLFACNKEGGGDDADKVIKFYLWHPEADTPAGFQSVIDLYNSTYAAGNGGYTLDFTFDTQNDYKEKLNMYFSAGQDDFDILFDANWMYINQFAANGYYKDLGNYFGNDAYPGLKKAFDDEYIANNKLFGKTYSIPFVESSAELRQRT